MGITETWLHDSIETEEIEIDGYQVVRKDRHGVKYQNRGGGALLYLAEDYTVQEIAAPYSS